ncbi:MAG: NAD(P)/FAD-dependent oxidoreductase [Brevinema sp.]
MKYLILGASAAGLNGAEAIRRADPKGEITLVSTDTEIYSRCMLHYFVSGHRSLESLNFKSPNFFDEFKIKWIKGVSATSLDTANKQVRLSDNTVQSFDKLLIATGASSFTPSIPHLKEANNVVGVRTLNDCFAIKEMMKSKKNVVIIGGGLVGADIATGISGMSARVSLVEIAGHILPLQLDKRAAKTYQDKLSSLGVEQHYSSSITDIVLDKQNNPVSVTLKTGESIPADFIISTAGICPNTDFLKDSGIALNNKAIAVNELGQTSHPDIFAAGDVTATAAIWSLAVKEGIAAGQNMAGVSTTMNDFFGYKSTINLFNIPTMSVGTEVASEHSSFTVEIQDDGENYKKIVHKDGKIYGAIIQGNLAYTGILTQLIKEKIDVSRLKKPIFDVDYADFFNISKNFEYTF